ncbi:hypothetical protein NFI96_032948 [Prochilodus magdalenae]|nr:hypothetical protein NFI96_032948 [Prochilodus magdalenae]
MRAALLFVCAVLALPSCQFLSGQELRRRNVLTLKEVLPDIVANQTLKIEFIESAAINSRSILVWRSHENNILWWEMQYDCFKAQVGHTVLVSVHDFNRTLINASYVPTVHKRHLSDAVPRFDVRVDTSAKIFMLTMESGQVLLARLCYNDSTPICEGLSPSKINTDLNPAVNFSFPFLVPCLCVQLYYTGPDTRRKTICPFESKRLPVQRQAVSPVMDWAHVHLLCPAGGGDILSNSSLTLYGSSVLMWNPQCTADPLKPSVSLCWQHHENQSKCFPVHNSTLLEKDRKYHVTAVDKHTRMCVKFSLSSSHRVFCPFSSGVLSEWDASVVPGSQCLHIQLSSNITASFSAQLCLEEEGVCVAKGDVHSIHMKEGAKYVELSLPLHVLIPGLCVQVSQSWFLELCQRCGALSLFYMEGELYAPTVSNELQILYMPPSPVNCTMWRSAERKPVLLVSSSDDAVHVCALASGLQEELRMDVRLPQWAYCSTQASLAELGPVPWVYGQCQEVQQAGGVVLLVWNLEAQQAFFQWKDREGKREKEGSWQRGEIGDEEKDTAWIIEQINKQKKGWMETKDMSSVTAQVFIATLSCLWAGLHSENGGQGFGLVCFQGFDGNCHIPKDLRGVRQYCLPRDLSNLIHELDLKESSHAGGVKEAFGGWCCLPRLFSKALSFWLSQRLAQRLETCLPQIDSEQDRENSKLMLKLSHKPHSEIKKEEFIVSSHCQKEKLADRKGDSVISSSVLEVMTILLIRASAKT